MGTQSRACQLRRECIFAELKFMIVPGKHSPTALSL